MQCSKRAYSFPLFSQKTQKINSICFVFNPIFKNLILSHTSKDSVLYQNLDSNLTKKKCGEFSSVASVNQRSLHAIYSFASYAFGAITAYEMTLSFLSRLVVDNSRIAAFTMLHQLNLDELS